MKNLRTNISMDVTIDIMQLHNYVCNLFFFHMNSYKFCVYAIVFMRLCDSVYIYKV